MIMSENEIKIYEEVLSGKRKRFPIDFFIDKDVAKRLIRYVVKKEYGENLTRDKIISLDSNFFIERKLKNALKYNFPFSILIAETFEDFEIYPFELRKVPDNYWKDSKNRVSYILWIFKKFSIDINDKNSVRKVTSDLIIKNNGSRAIREAGGLYNLLNEVLQDKYKPWEIIDIPYWNYDLSNEAIEWLLEKKLHYSKEEILSWEDNNISTMCSAEDIRNNNLEGLWKNVFFHSVIKMVRSVY